MIGRTEVYGNGSETQKRERRGSGGFGHGTRARLATRLDTATITLHAHQSPPYMPVTAQP